MSAPAEEPAAPAAAPPGPHHLGPAAGWQGRLVAALNRRRRLSVLVPFVVAVLAAPHACPFC